jgi:hypothetical protein
MGVLSGARRVAKAARKASTTAQDKVKKEAGVDTRFSRKGYKQYMDVVDRNAFDEEMQIKLAKRAAKEGMTKKEANAMASEQLQKLRTAMKVDTRTDNVVKGVRKARNEMRDEIKEKRKSKEGTQGTGFRFATGKTTTEEAAGRINARTGGDDRFAYEQEYGRGGKEKITQGSKSFARMEEAASKGSRERSKVVGELETKREKGTITKEERTLLNRLNRLSREADQARTRKAGATLSSESRKDKGVSVQGMEGIERIGAKPKLKDSEMMVGNTTNGITKDGEVIGNPTDNQIKMVIRNLEARERLSAEAKRNLAKLKRMTQSQKQDAAIRKMERNLKDTGKDRQQRNKGGLIESKANQKGLKKLPQAVRNKMGYMKRGGMMKTGHMDMRKNGIFYK